MKVIFLDIDGVLHPAFPEGQAVFMRRLCEADYKKKGFPRKG